MDIALPNRLNHSEITHNLQSSWETVSVETLIAWTARDRDITKEAFRSLLPSPTGSRKQVDTTTWQQTWATLHEKVGQNQEPEGWSLSHRGFFPSPETQSRNIHHLPGWILEQLWTSASFLPFISFVLNCNVYSYYPIPAHHQPS